jgi:hypothetical protein
MKIHILTDPFDSNRLAGTQIEKAYYFLYGYIPWIINLLLLLRLAAVYPLGTHSKMTIAGVFVFPVAIKIAWIVAAALGLKALYEASSRGFEAIMNTAWTSPWPRVEWFLQIFDNRFVFLKCYATFNNMKVLSYLCGLFLYKLHISLGGNSLVISNG